MEPWYRVTIPRKEVRQGRSFNPDEFAIHLEQVIARTAPEDYREPDKFFSRTCFTRALREHAGMVLRRLSGETANTAPVMTLITQFGGGKTHTLTALYHLATSGAKASEYPGVADLIREAGLRTVPEARVAAFVGNAWDPQEGRETPWIDVARQLAGDRGVQELGASARTTPPGTEPLNRVFKAAGGPVLLLFDEVLNFLNRHRAMADSFHAFIQNLTVATTGTTLGAAVISLPRSQVEMTDWDMQWQDRITKVVRRVAKDLIANDEAEISDVVRRRLFEDIGSDRIRKNVSKTYADWCFERRAQLPPEWTAVDSAATEAGAREYLRGRFEICYPFHPATLSVFQRKWQALSQYQQTRGTLAMLAQWISCLFESSGGQVDKVAHLPELRFALGEPEVDTTSVDNAAFALEDKSYFIRRVGSDEFKISHQPTMKKVVSDRRSSLDEESEVKPAMRVLVQKEFDRGASIPVVPFPSDGASVQDTPKLTLVVFDPNSEWIGTGSLRELIAQWTRQRGKSPRLYPGPLVWCLKKPGRDLRNKVELSLAWKRVAKEISEGTLGGDFDRTDRVEIQAKVKETEDSAKDEVWGGYRFAVIADNREPDGLKVIDLGAGHSSSSESLCGRVITALKSQALLNESVGAGYIGRNWPPALKESGAWPLLSLRQSFLNGSLTRLLDPDTVLRGKIVEFVAKGEFGLASGQKPGGEYERIWFNEPMAPDEVSFESGVFLLLKDKAGSLKSTPKPISPAGEEPFPSPEPEPQLPPGREPEPEPEPEPTTATRAFLISGQVPPEIWNRLGTKVLPKLRSGSDLKIEVEFSVIVERSIAHGFEADLKQILYDLGLSGRIKIE